ncbi:MAG: hypothetical protein KDB27_29245 [Planctomycetales bacterium]|nr:hypothetical protein [Planctomycetales bacterium]
MKSRQLQFEDVERREVFSAGPLAEFAPDTESVGSQTQVSDVAELDLALAELSEARTDTQRSDFMDDPALNPSGKLQPPILANDPTFPFENATAVDVVFSGQEDDGKVVLIVDGKIVVGGEPDLTTPTGDPPADAPPANDPPADAPPANDPPANDPPKRGIFRKKR